MCMKEEREESRVGRTIQHTQSIRTSTRQSQLGVVL